MNTVQLLDCTLRDGGYCNQWNFGYENIQKITQKLVEANVEIIECGFLTEEIIFNRNVTKFDKVEQIKDILPKKKNDKLFVAMMNYGEYNIDSLPNCDGNSINGIRVAFHKKDVKDALTVCKKIQKKGYRVFIQAMVSLCYSDEEFLDLIHRVNELNPYAFYIVDSFGMMKAKDLIRLFYMVEHNLNGKIRIGFHSHNNMQLAYSNAQTLMELQTNRNLIIDSSVYGMGRGAGNLNTELFIDYLNENFDKRYNMQPVLSIIDEIISDFYERNYWGYSLPNYIAAAHNAHPNYASYLDDKKTITVEEMNEIFDMMDNEKKYSYDNEYIKELYLNYMSKENASMLRQNQLKKILKEKTIILIAPGKTAEDQKEIIREYAEKHDTVKISVNFDYPFIETDFIFVSNIRRFKELQETQKCIITSNIHAKEVYYQTEYKDLLAPIDSVRDNAGMMAIKFLMNYEVKEILLAGFDGYSHDIDDNYLNSQMTIMTKNELLDSMNAGMNLVLNQYAEKLKIVFLTKPKHLKI